MVPIAGVESQTMSFLAVVLGVFLVISVLADVVNTLVSTTTSRSRFWLTHVVYTGGWFVVSRLARRIKNESIREAVLSIFAPLSLLGLLSLWVAQQLVGFALIWWGIGGVDGANSFFDCLYYSGVVYFTLGFGEIVPLENVPRFGALIEAMSGVLTTALVIGYLPALYSAYSEREQKLMTLDDGSEERITPDSLVVSRSPTANPADVLSFFEGWEEWASSVLETHTTLPMLRLFRSKQADQNWITALGLLCDAALQCQVIVETRNRSPYWFLRRAIVLFEELADGQDLSPYRKRLDDVYDERSDGGVNEQFLNLYYRLEQHGFELVPMDEAREETLALRRRFDAQMEFLIDYYATPRGFWGHKIGLKMAPTAATKSN